MSPVIVIVVQRAVGQLGPEVAADGWSGAANPGGAARVKVAVAPTIQASSRRQTRVCRPRVRVEPVKLYRIDNQRRDGRSQFGSAACWQRRRRSFAILDERAQSKPDRDV